MTLTQLAVAGVRHYWRTHVATMLGVAAAVAVLAGSLLVGASVRASLASIATERLGRTSVVVNATQPFGEELATRLSSAGPWQVAPMLVMTISSLSSFLMFTDGSVGLELMSEYGGTWTFL